MILRDIVVQSAQKMPDALAVKGPDTSLTYGELDDLANRFAHALAKLGVRRGDRVGIWLGKSVHAVTDRKSTRLNSSHQIISYAVFCLKKKNNRRSDT